MFPLSQDTKTESSLNTVKLSFLILLCVTEDTYANALVHDPNLVSVLKLHFMDYCSFISYRIPR